MRVAIVQSSEITRYRRWCLSAKRFTGGCHECTRVERCEIPVAKEARIRLLEEQRESAHSEYLLKLAEIEHRLSKIHEEKKQCLGIK